MSRNKLYIFEKDTDATASIRGYSFQAIRTLEIWISNVLEKIDDEIYCDFEEDIFQKNSILQTAMFSQIKLYSANFAFNDVEIQKCIAHFFMLHVKSDYKNLDKEFVFEANSNIRRKSEKNDAELLRRWNKNQDNLPKDLLAECCAKVKSIVSNYINQQSKKLESKHSKDDIKAALGVFNSIDENDWKEFTKRIKWKFAGQEPEIEFANTIERIYNLILKLQHPFAETSEESIFALLHSTIILKSSESQPENRKLTTSDFENIILKAGDDEDKMYSKAYEIYSNIPEFKWFKIGEFFEILNAVKHCRRRKYLKSHDEQWLLILNVYIEKLDLTVGLKRNAIYEFLWLKFRSDDIYEMPEGSLVGTEDLIRYYFQDFDLFRNPSDLRDAQSLLQIIYTANIIKRVDISKEEIQSWFNQIIPFAEGRIIKTITPNEQCQFYEIIGTQMFFQSFMDKTSSTDFLIYFEKVLEIIKNDKAKFYDIYNLGGRINEYIKVLIFLNSDDDKEVIDKLDLFSEKLDKIIEKREGSYKAGKKQLERGNAYLKSKDSTHILKALNCFHKVKNLWHQQETKEGLILAILAISRLYAVMGLNLAAKYYAVAGCWICFQSGDRNLLKHVITSLGMIFHSDFRQGALLNAINNFRYFIRARDQFNPHPITLGKEKMVAQVLGDFSVTLFCLEKISNQYEKLIEIELNDLQQNMKEGISALVEKFNDDYGHDDKFNKFIQSQFIDSPGNDVGDHRNIQFYALGSLWKISFENSYEVNSIAEEFCAMLQTMLAEISLSISDFHFLKTTIDIEIEIVEKNKEPQQIPTNKEYKWKVFLEYSDSPQPEEIHLSSGKVLTTLYFILNEISLLIKDEFKDSFQKLFSEDDLSSKLMVANSYQRMYRSLFSEADFKKMELANYQNVNLDVKFPKENIFLKWKKHISPKYNEAKSIVHIQSRYQSYEKTMYLTLQKLEENSDFKEYIKVLRSQGWLDWQIIMTMSNFIVDYKSELKLKSLTFKTDEELVNRKRQIISDFVNLDEKDFAVEFPLSAFQTEGFFLQLKWLPIYTLESFGLQMKSRYPNFDAVKEFLDIRFRLNLDEDDTFNPLKGI